MARTINLDAKLAAKGEVTREPITVTFRGSDWNFSPSMPAELPELAGEGKIVGAILLALDAEQRDAFRDLGVTVEEVGALIEALAEAYGVTPGESSASE